MNFSEVEIEIDKTKIHVKKATGEAPVGPTGKPVKQEQPFSDSVISSPMVGVVHLEKQLKVGQKVAVGDVVAQIESMKLFNDVTSSQAGVVSQLYVKDGDPVEFHQSLIALTKDNKHV
ncbi:acetyl-CoA carboxylase biotin carboxyl carrier protein subunit [Pediococcus damnosus]|nr:acetyl-CoA carboxylase biotin carboxyl carrier protein subunit [Pediococcus damnosus]